MKETNTGAQKIINYLEEFINSYRFQNEITKIREKYKIPPKGYELSQNDKIQMKKSDNFYFPALYKDEFVNLIIPFGRDLEKIQKMTHLRFIGFKKILYLYLFHNILFKDILIPYLEKVNLCKVADSADEYNDFYLGNDAPMYLDHVNRENEHFPLHLRISPYASKRDIIRFIEKNFSNLIKPLQEKYKDPDTNLGKVKKRRKRERNNLIYDFRSRGMTLDQIKDAISTKSAENLGYEDIGKILSLERKRRKKV